MAATVSAFVQHQICQWWSEIKLFLFCHVHYLWVPILCWPTCYHHYCFCSVPFDLCYHLTYKTKRLKNVKVSVMPNHQEGIDCDCIWLWMLWNLSICLFILEAKKSVSGLPKCPNDTFKHHSKFCVVRLQLFYFFPIMWTADIQNLFLIANSHISMAILLQVMDFVPPMLLM